MSGINLIPPERARIRSARMHRRIWVRVWIVAVVTLGITSLWLERMKDVRVRDASDLRGRYSLLQEQVRMAENLIRERERLERRRAAVGVIQEDRPAALLLELTGESLPEAAHLSFFRFDRGQTGESRQEIARLIDVAPTLLARAGAPVPIAMQGVDLATDPAALEPKDREHYAEEDHEGNVIWTLRTRDAKLIVANPDNPRGLPERAFFEIGSDPGETRNLHGVISAEQEQQLERHAELQRSFAEGKAVADGKDVEMSREECEQLRLLGYVEDCSHLENRSSRANPLSILLGSSRE